MFKYNISNAMYMYMKYSYAINKINATNILYRKQNEDVSEI